MKIPSDLLENKQLKLSPLLIKSYIDKLNVLGKFEESKVNLQGSIGGNDEDEAINHFVGRFANGAVRSQYVVINPDGDLEHIASQLATVFSDKTLKILYLPCGSGAGLIGLLTTFFTLRQHKYYPTLPLNIEIIGADYSSDALSIFTEMMNSISKEFLTVGINISYSTQQWDATKSLETMQLMHQLFDDSADEYFVFLSNFSGEAGKHSKFDSSFETIFNYVVTKKQVSTLLWIEPDSNKSKSLLQKIKQIFEPILSFIGSILTDNSELTNIPPRNFKFLHPTSGKELRGHISGLRLIIDGKD